jgi:hypothetical protein
MRPCRSRTNTPQNIQYIRNNKDPDVGLPGAAKPQALYEITPLNILCRYLEGCNNDDVGKKRVKY